jgi:hypothetical protein
VNSQQCSHFATFTSIIVAKHYQIDVINENVCFVCTAGGRDFDSLTDIGSACSNGTSTGSAAVGGIKF